MAAAAAPPPSELHLALPYYALALFSVVSMSTSATWIRLMPASVPSILKMTWRLFYMSLFQAPLAVLEWHRLPPEGRVLLLRSVPLLAALSPILACNYFSYATSVDSTSLVHAVLLAATASLQLVAASAIGVAVVALATCARGGRRPAAAAAAETTDEHGEGDHVHLATKEAVVTASVVIARSESTARAEAWLGIGLAGGGDGAASPSGIHHDHDHNAGSPADKPSPPLPLQAPTLPPPPPLTLVTLFLGTGPPRLPSAIEVVGTLVGFVATTFVILESTASSGSSSSLARAPTLKGDMFALLCSASFALYLVSFSRLRAAGLPAFLVMAPANALASTLLALASLAFGITDFATLTMGAFASPLITGLVAATVVFPGLLGYTLMSVSLRRVPPLANATLSLLQPPIGTVFGYFAGVQAAPTVTTLVAGLAVLFSAGLVVFGSARRAAAEKREAEHAAVAAAGGGGGGGAAHQ